MSYTDRATLILGVGLYTSQLSSTPVPEVLARPALIPYPDSASDAGQTFVRAPTTAQLAIPIGVAISQWHWILLYHDKMVGISRETEKVVFDEKIALVGSDLYSADL